MTPLTKENTLVAYGGPPGGLLAGTWIVLHGCHFGTSLCAKMTVFDVVDQMCDAILSLLGIS